MAAARTLAIELPALGAGYLLSNLVHSRVAVRARDGAKDFLAMLKISVYERFRR